MSNAGMKFDGGKPDLTLLEPMKDALAAVAQVLEFGAKKYARDSWQDVPDGQRRYKAAAMRHSLHALGELDSESGLLHAAHEACSILFAIQLKLNEKKVVDLDVLIPDSDFHSWVHWNPATGECPVDGSVLIDVETRAGTFYECCKAGECYWEPDSCIVKWRIHNG